MHASLIADDVTLYFPKFCVMMEVKEREMKTTIIMWAFGLAYSASSFAAIDGSIKSAQFPWWGASLSPPRVPNPLVA